MTPNMKEWLIELYREAAKEHIDTGNNELIWSTGAPTEEEAELHENNAREHFEFAFTLQAMARQIDEE